MYSSDHVSDEPLILIQWHFLTKLPFKICFFSWELQGRYGLWVYILLIPSKNLGNPKQSIAVHYSVGPEFYRKGKTMKYINQKSYVKQNVGQFWIGNPFTLIRRHCPKRHSSFLDCLMKLPPCHVYLLQ